MDALVVLFVIILAVVTAVFVYGKSGEAALTATVKHRGETVAQVALDTLAEDKIITVDGKYHLTVTLTKDGAVKLVEELCACRMPYVCPRGKPVMIFTSTRELDRKFSK